MSEFTLEKAYEAWGDPISAYLRDPSPEELTAITPEIPEEDRANMTVGQLEDKTKEIWKQRQVRNIVGLMRKEAAFARRNEHHVLNGIFGKEFYESLTDQQKDALKARFAELNEAVKAEF